MHASHVPSMFLTAIVPCSGVLLQWSRFISVIASCPGQEHALHSSRGCLYISSSAVVFSSFYFLLQAHSHFFQEAFLGFSAPSDHQSLSHLL